MRIKGQLLVKNDAKKLYFVLIWQDAVFQEEGWDLLPLSGTSKPNDLSFLRNGMEWNTDFGLRPSTGTHWVIQRCHEKMIDEILKR